MNSCKKGDLVRVLHHRDKRVVGLIFCVDLFSTMDFCSGCPIIKNPHMTNSSSEPLYLRFEPENLEEVGALDLLVDALRKTS